MSDMDPGDCTDQLAFDVPRQPVCAACGAKARNLCAFDYQRSIGEDPGRRPTSCLGRWDPATAPWPPGFGEAA